MHCFTVGHKRDLITVQPYHGKRCELIPCWSRLVSGRTRFPYCSERDEILHSRNWLPTFPNQHNYMDLSYKVDGQIAPRGYFHRQPFRGHSVWGSQTHTFQKSLSGPKLSVMLVRLKTAWRGMLSMHCRCSCTQHQRTRVRHRMTGTCTFLYLSSLSALSCAVATGHWLAWARLLFPHAVAGHRSAKTCHPSRYHMMYAQK